MAVTDIDVIDALALNMAEVSKLIKAMSPEHKEYMLRYSSAIYHFARELKSFNQIVIDATEKRT
jgi:hypothetical protein